MGVEARRVMVRLAAEAPEFGLTHPDGRVPQPGRMIERQPQEVREVLRGLRSEDVAGDMLPCPDGYTFDGRGLS